MTDYTKSLFLFNPKSVVDIKVDPDVHVTCDELFSITAFNRSLWGRTKDFVVTVSSLSWVLEAD